MTTWFLLFLNGTWIPAPRCPTASCQQDAHHSLPPRFLPTMVAAVKSFRSQEKVPLHAILVQSEITQIQRVKISTTNAKKLWSVVYIWCTYFCVCIFVCVWLVVQFPSKFHPISAPLPNSTLPPPQPIRTCCRYSSFSVNWYWGYFGDPWKSFNFTRPGISHLHQGRLHILTFTILPASIPGAMQPKEYIEYVLISRNLIPKEDYIKWKI